MGYDSVALPDNLRYALAYQPKAVETCMSDLYRVIHAEAEQVYQIRGRGN